MEPMVVFYRLSQKIVNNRENIPENAGQVMYYSLAIGHHVGVMDCFSELMAIPAGIYKQCLDHLPDGAARCKLEGALKWNEIEINRSHVDELLPALTALSARLSDSDSEWVQILLRCLREMKVEPAFYLMVKMRE
jgi:hydrogenase-4 component J